MFSNWKLIEKHHLTVTQMASPLLPQKFLSGVSTQVETSPVTEQLKRFGAVNRSPHESNPSDGKHVSRWPPPSARHGREASSAQSHSRKWAVTPLRRYAEIRGDLRKLPASSARSQVASRLAPVSWRTSFHALGNKRRCQSGDSACLTS